MGGDYIHLLVIRVTVVWAMNVWVVTAAATALTSVAATSLVCLAVGKGVQRACRMVSRRSVPSDIGLSGGGAKCGAQEFQIASASCRE